MGIELHGYEFSVYAWIARLALHEKGVAYQWVEVNPFAAVLPAGYLAKHPFGRVPSLVDGDFVLYETNAITRWIDEAFAGASLQPTSPEARARLAQIVSIVDAYAYWPLVREVFSHGFFRPRMGRSGDAAAYRRGLDAAPRILGALEDLVGGGEVLVGDAFSLADIHLAPMIAYFTAAPAGLALLEGHEKLSRWWRAVSARTAFLDTTPPLPAPAP